MNHNETPTPRTDAIVAPYIGDNCENIIEEADKLLDVARQLERELIQCQKELKDYKALYDAALTHWHQSDKHNEALQQDLDQIKQEIKCERTGRAEMLKRTPEQLADALIKATGKWKG